MIAAAIATSTPTMDCFYNSGKGCDWFCVAAVQYLLCVSIKSVISILIWLSGATFDLTALQQLPVNPAKDHIMDKSDYVYTFGICKRHRLLSCSSCWHGLCSVPPPDNCLQHGDLVSSKTLLLSFWFVIPTRNIAMVRLCGRRKTPNRWS